MNRIAHSIQRNALLLTGKLRRKVQVTFRKKKVLTCLENRTGECRQCANCCKLVFHCPFLASDNLCRIYRSKLRPGPCVHFPLDGRDLEDVRLSSGTPCGYAFTEPEE